MAENSPYFESIVAARAMLLDPEQYQEDHTVSLETQSEVMATDIASFIQEHFKEFFDVLKYLSKEDQELLLCYYLLSKTQWSIARIYNSTQTICSFKLRLAVKKLGTFMLLGIPTQEKIHEILVAFGRSELEGISLAEIISHYSKARSFKETANAFHLKRPDVRRALSKLVKDLMKERNSQFLALGAYIFGLIDKASAQGKGLSNREKIKICPIYRKDPELLGRFEVDVDHPDFEHMLVTKANY